MDCPVCKDADLPMITLEFNYVEVDYCQSCKGIWLDGGELEQLLGDSKKSKALLKSFKIDNISKEAARFCPICNAEMDKVYKKGQSEKIILIDSCPKNHGLWFDKNELADIISEAQLDEDRKIQDLLKDIFQLSK